MPGIRVRGHSCLCEFIVCAAAFAQDPVARGIEEFHQGKYETSKITLEQALKQKPDDAHARTFLALARAATGGCDGAVTDLADIFAQNKDADLRRLAGLALAQCHMARDRYDLALPVVLGLEKQFSADADVLYEAAKLHMKAWNDAVSAMYQKAPASFRVNQLSGEIFEIQGRYQDAATEYRKAIGKNPAAVNLHYRLGRALLLESHDPGNLREAHKEFEAELALNPDDAVAEYQVGQILLAEQNSPAAAARFERAISLNPEFVEALVALAKTKSDAKKYAEAIPLLERAAKLQPTSESAHYSLMLAYRNAGRIDDAQREKSVLDKLQRPPEGEFTDFLKKLGEKAPKQ